MVNPLSFNRLASRNAVVAGDEWQRNLASTSRRPRSPLLLNQVSAGTGFEFSARIGLRYSLHQFADFHLKELIRDDQRSHGIARVAVRALIAISSRSDSEIGWLCGSAVISCLLTGVTPNIVPLLFQLSICSVLF